MERLTEIPEELRADLDHRREGAKLYREAEQEYWSTLWGDLDLNITTPLSRIHHAKNLLFLAKNTATSLLLDEMQEHLREYELSIGGAGIFRVGDKSVFHEDVFDYPDTELQLQERGQVIEVMASGVKTTIDDREFRLLKPVAALPASDTIADLSVLVGRKNIRTVDIFNRR